MSDFFFAPESASEGDLTVRSYQLGDGPALAAAVNASYEHLRPWMPWARPDQGVEESEAHVRRFRGEYLQNANFAMSIWRDGPAGPEFVGGTGYHRFDLDLGNADIGMWIAAGFAGQGLGTRALHLLLRWGFTAWPWVRLTWHCDGHNLASARTAEKAGMRLEGVLRQDSLDTDGRRCDTRVYAMLKDEWEHLP